jgi:CO/xanthine dehydrogenase FAD-binding subunit
VLQEYLMPSTVDEAMTALKKHESNSYIIAGGTDVMVNLQEKKINPSVLVDISGIEELKELRLDGDVIRIGAGVTHNQVAKSALIQEKAGVLAMASREVGSLQIRNVATLVGNVVSAQPAADAAIALVALDAVAEIIGVDGKKEMSVLDLYGGVGVCNVDCTLELVTALKFPALKKNQGRTFPESISI